MAASVNNNSEIEKSFPGSAPAVQMQELSSALTPERLDGTNYVEWSLNAQNKIRGRKLSYYEGDLGFA
ncbi:retrovirus-related Pol polyprotein from transposon TNT 1-94 [Sesbania bispinosa]|nr:retrovirus-related Pol polyprotein from transposon TNT 1-94 [Sesbania bispinosa]